ncbi:hypothetical protein [Streptomyces hydrogenans]|uniref:hypothetical protein n=1 Tax=Streptomyces hydrogenans TaxID=1873719 RepID=UPI0035E1496F
MTVIKVPLQCHRSAVESAIGNQRSRRSTAHSAVSAVEMQVPAPYARKSINAGKVALTALTALPPHLTSENSSAINGTATALPLGGTR